MRVSLSEVTALAWPFERDVAAFAAAAVDGIGVSARKLEAYGVARGVRLVREAGLGVSCLMAPGGFPLGDGAGERGAVERMRGWLETAAALDAGCLLLVSGPPGPLAWEEAAARCRPLLELLVRDAERAGVRLALEPTNQLRMDLSFLHSFDEALDFVDGIGSPWLGVVLEVSNAWIERRLYANIAARRDRIALVQLSDFRIGTLQTSDRVVPGDGDIPLRRICAALAAAGYDGWYDLELLGPAIEAEGYPGAIARSVARFRGLRDADVSPR